MATGGTLFEELGFYYVGPVDAHDLDNLVPILENIRDNVPNTKPVLLHVKSVKGKGEKFSSLLALNCFGLSSSMNNFQSYLWGFSINIPHH